MDFYPVPSVPFDECDRNIVHALTLGLPRIERAGDVAVVGGGPSLAHCLDELRDWKGPIWAINQTFMWLRERGIRATFLTADPKDQPWIQVHRADDAIVGLHGCPALFERLSECRVRTYRPGEEIPCSTTTATTAPGLALYIGHRSVTFFGCESSFEAHVSHVYDQPLPSDLIIVECGGKQFATKPEFLMQADALSTLIRGMPGFCKDRSGGLLAALIECPERTVIGAMPDFLKAVA